MKDFVVGLCFFCGVISNVHADWERISPSTIRLSGEIEKGSLEKYVEIAKTGYSKLILQSFGGTPLIALKIAEDIEKRDVEIVIDGYCFSACANYLALAGKHLTVPCESLIGWHGTPTLQSKENVEKEFEAKSYPKELTSTYLRWLNDFKMLEQNFFKKVGVDYQLLGDSVIIPFEENIKPKVSFKFDEATADMSVSTSAMLWIPTADVLKKYGVNTNNFCKSYSHDDIKTLVEKKGFKVIFSSSARK